LNSAAHVRASTMPLTPSPWARWKRSTAARVIGPKMPSGVTATWRWIATTAGPTSPKRSSCVRPPVAAAREDRSSPESTAPERPEPDEVPPRDTLLAKAGITGAASIAAPTASDVPLRR
jgi:hypothetical protein